MSSDHRADPSLPRPQAPLHTSLPSAPRLRSAVTSEVPCPAPGSISAPWTLQPPLKGQRQHSSRRKPLRCDPCAVYLSGAAGLGLCGVYLWNPPLPPSLLLSVPSPPPHRQRQSVCYVSGVHMSDGYLRQDKGEPKELETNLSTELRASAKVRGNTHLGHREAG